VRFLQSTVRSIDPKARRVVADDGTFEADILVVALGADLDPAATSGLVVLPRFERGPVIIGVTGKSFKCPPAPSETALLLHDYLVARGRRG
jgi:sulfide:quinone oxidoreductase